MSVCAYQISLLLTSLPSAPYISDWQLYPDPEKASPLSFAFHIGKPRTLGPAYKGEKLIGIIEGCPRIYNPG